MAQTERPASHRIFMAVPPPAPVPTTITSNIFVGAMTSRSLIRRDGDRSLRFSKMQMFGITRVRTARHRRPHGPQSRIAKTLESDFRCVVADDGVVAHKLEELPPALCRWLELSLVSQLFQQGFLLIGPTVHEFMTERAT